jgi:hypothetical protein
MRSLSLWIAAFAVSGCAAERDSFDPIEPGSLTRGVVRCSADEGGNLHVRAPADAQVTTLAGDDAAADIAYGEPGSGDYQMPRPHRPMSRSLGFIGDAPLAQQPNHGGRYSYGAHDNLIGPHRHTAADEWSHGPTFAGRPVYRGPRW